MKKVNSGSGFFIRLIQSFVIIVFLLGGYYLFKGQDVNIHLADLLLVIAFTPFFADIYYGLLYWGGKLKNAFIKKGIDQ